MKNSKSDKDFQKFIHRNKLKKMILEIMSQFDIDFKLSEDPKIADWQMEPLIDIADKHVRQLAGHYRS